MENKFKRLKRFNEMNESSHYINWGDMDIKDIENFEKRIQNEILTIDDIDERMQEMDRLLEDIEEKYPMLYDEIEMELRDLVV